MNIKEKFGKKVKQLREEHQYSIEYLANISNVDVNILFKKKITNLQK
jgi:transcriptional regulator with XRE-family HTH domain